LRAKYPKIPLDIAKEKHNLETINSQLAMPLCHQLNTQNPQCTCLANQYAWHDINEFKLGKKTKRGPYAPPPSLPPPPPPPP
jgi:hypothetical protein